MFKVLIADDEPKIRRGLLEALDWEKLDMLVVGEARDGKEALEIIRKEKPDICLVDICMPLISGLELIRDLKKENPKTLCIIITGHDEFEYAQSAVKLKVFDYILKPVSEEELLKIVLKAKKELEDVNEREKRYEWAHIQLKKNMPLLRGKFVSDWLEGKLEKEEILEYLDFHDMVFDGDLGLVLLKTQGVVHADKTLIEWERQLLFFSIQNIFEEMLDSFKPFVIARDKNENFAAIVTITDRKAWMNFKSSLEGNVEKFLNHKVSVYTKNVKNLAEGVPEAYEEIGREMHSDEQCLPIIKKVKAYIERNFKDHDLSLNKISNQMQISVSYLSKLFKQEMGMSFIDYLIRIRIKEAIKLMNDPMMKIYEIAEEVGYSSQHYFCVAFKKVLGVSPTEYKQKGN